MIINVLMPTYNDEKTIKETLDSLKNQTYDNWHLTIVNDGSVDNTEKVIKKYIKENKLEKKITYIYEDNADQLNALKKGLSTIKKNDGLIFVLHSDDVMDNDYVFEKAVDFFNNNDDVDAIISGYSIINEKSEMVGYQRVKKYNNKYSNVALMGLWLGRNLFVDVAFWKCSVYKEKVSYNYLDWNTPFWFCHEKEMSLLNVKNVDFSFFKYRVFEGNYINNEVGMLNVLNGEIRSLLLTLNIINIPFYKCQYFLFRLFNKFHLGYKVLYQKKQSRDIYSILKFVINKRISDKELEKYPYYTAVLNFFKNRKSKSIELYNVNSDDVFLGSDVRLFNKKMLNKKLPKIYYRLFDFMNDGFDTIITDDKSYNSLVNILKFMDIFEYVNIKTKKI